ncbi:hypothetical protein M2336_000297 [Sphingobium sp. B1D7B]|uniref:hypothetical protein n=1 Tax=unclassified Sphingobium TaxID=2611147 RepID=UPI002224B7AC|nr:MULTISPECIES: hypothetical protein [unclassified Sphingobium]MCW2391912.1 hypothetical protein [Sphingobium sp. B11D3A]MCW2403668.1 hypothetical protein [Sphingobium sp. B1D7B]
MSAGGKAIVPHSPSASTSSNIVQLAAANRLKPLQQGELDCFCGIYAAINAVRLSAATLGIALSRLNYGALFHEAVAFVSKKDPVEALTWGLSLRRRLAVTKLIARAASLPRHRFLVERPDYRKWSAIDDAFEWIEVSLVSGKPVLLYLAEDPDHYTVVSGITPTALNLFDSIGMKLIRRKNCGFANAPRIVWPPGMMRLAITPAA